MGVSVPPRRELPTTITYCISLVAVVVMQWKAHLATFLRPYLLQVRFSPQSAELLCDSDFEAGFFLLLLFLVAISRFSSLLACLLTVLMVGIQGFWPRAVDSV